jgi:hypothetical protein
MDDDLQINPMFETPFLDAFLPTTQNQSTMFEHKWPTFVGDHRLNGLGEGSKF